MNAPVSNDTVVVDANACIFKELAFSLGCKVIKHCYFDSLQLFFKKCNELAVEICFFELIAIEAKRNLFNALRILCREHHLDLDAARRAGYHLTQRLEDLFKNKITQRIPQCTEEQMQEMERFYEGNAHCRKHLIGAYSKDIIPSEADLKILAGTINLQTKGNKHILSEDKDFTDFQPEIANKWAIQIIGLKQLATQLREWKWS